MLRMSEPWFRPYAWFSYRPITWQGRALLAGMAAITIPLGLVWLFNADTRPLLAWTAGGLAAVAALIGHAIIVWKMERDYGRR